MPIAYGDVITGVLSPAPSATTRNVHVNDQLPGRFMVTWNGVPEVFEIGSNTMQATLFSDGRVQFVYRGVTADDAIVGVSPGNGASPLEVDFTNAPFSGQGAVAIFEEFDGPIGPDSTAEDPPGDRPFDLDGAALAFTPNTSGGFDVELVADGGQSVAPLRTGSKGRIASGATSGTAPGVGSISGQLLSSEDRPMIGVEILVTSSGDPSFQARLTTDAAGRFRLDSVPFGGVNVVSVENGRQTQRGAGILDATDPHLHLVLRPRATKSKVR